MPQKFTNFLGPGFRNKNTLPIVLLYVKTVKNERYYCNALMIIYTV